MIYNTSVKTINNVISAANNGDIIKCDMGCYPKIQINSLKTHFELDIIGEGELSIFDHFYLNGFFNITFENIKMMDIDLNVFNSIVTFKNVIFYGFKQMIIHKSKNENNIYDFNTCVFDQSFQIHYRGGEGNSTIFFTNCIFKGSLPIIQCDHGKIQLSFINCTFDHFLCYNRGSKVIINTDSPFKISEGEECDVIYNKLDIDEKIVSINSDIYSEYTIKLSTEFIEISGTSICVLVLPIGIKNGHLIEIVTNTDLSINDVIYKNRYLHIRYVKDKWIFY